MQCPRPSRTIFAALILAATALPPAARADDPATWRATRSRDAAPVVAERTSNTSSAPRLVSTWSRIRQVEFESTPCGSEWPSLVSSANRPRSPHPPIELITHTATPGFPECPPDVPVFADVFAGDPAAAYSWQLLPPGLLFKSYIAGIKESRLGTATLHRPGGDTVQESTLGARVAIFRYGTPMGIRPEGWELGFEGAAFLRQNWSEDLDVDAVDFRYGVPLTWRRGPWAAKFAFYHLSSHAGDEFLIRNPGFQRRNYVRDALLLGLSYHVTPDWRVYGEVGYAVHTDGGAEPWELQFGAEYSPIARNGLHGSPFFAINGHLREEFDFGGGVNVLLGWQWRSRANDHVFRIGGQYYNGKSLQFEFFDRHEQFIGGGVWYDF